MKVFVSRLVLIILIALVCLAAPVGASTPAGEAGRMNGCPAAPQFGLVEPCAAGGTGNSRTVATQTGLPLAGKIVVAATLLLFGALALAPFLLGDQPIATDAAIQINR